MTIAEIAKIANTSKATVSLALNNKPGVSPVTRKLIMEIAAEVGYAPAVKPVAKKNIRLIAVLKQDLNDFNCFGTSLFAELINSIQTHCAELGYNLIYMSVPHTNFISTIKTQESENPSCGILLIGTYLNEDEIEQLRDIHDTLVVLDNPCNRSNINSVTMNNYLGGYAAASHIIKLGHKNIGYVQSTSHVANHRDRFAGFNDALKENGLSLPANRIFPSNCYANSNVNNLSLSIGRNENMPTAFFCENDYHAFCLISALTKLGFKVPEDVSVVGFDNVQEAQLSTPSLTTLSVNRKAMSHTAVNRLHEIITKQGDNFTQKIAISVDLIVRDSSLSCSK